MREDCIAMYRIRNEQRWIRRSLERTWQVCESVVIFDDHSSDNTFTEILWSMGESDVVDAMRNHYGSKLGGGINPPPRSIQVTANGRHLHWITSPFQDTVDEVRDKNHLWQYVCDLKFRHVLCLDGDEMLSQAAIRHFASATDRLEHGGADVIVMPFIYLWDAEDKRRVDGVYADIRHARMFTVDRAPYFRECQFAARGRAGFHCGSIPDRLSINHFDMREMEIIHFGYIDNAIRRAKLLFYNDLDPNNEGEGYYRHIVGESNHLAPGPVRVVDYLDK